VWKKLIKKPQPFGKKFQKTVGGWIFLTHTVDVNSAGVHSSILQRDLVTIRATARIISYDRLLTSVNQTHSHTPA